MVYLKKHSPNPHPPLGPDPEWRAKVISEMTKQGKSTFVAEDIDIKGPMGWPVDEHH